MAKTTETVDAGTGDVFRDLGGTDAAERKHYKLNRFPSERLLHFMTQLDRSLSPRASS